MSNKILTESKLWNATKREILEGVTGDRHAVTERLLENQRQHLLEAASLGSITAGQIAALPKIMMPVIRRVFPTLIAHDLVGVQPLSGPQGFISTKRIQYANTVPTDGSGVITGEEALSPFKVAAFYSGNEDPTNPQAANTAFLEGRLGNKLSFSIVKQAVEAKSRSLNATWTMEAMQDAQSQYGIDIESEVVADIANELSIEIDQELLATLRGTANVSATYDQAATSGVATSVVDEHAALAVLINREAARIAQRTRGMANWVVVSGLVSTVLTSATASRFVATTEGPYAMPENNKKIGRLGNLDVFVDTYASDTEAVLVGRKGTGATESGVFFCPYMPLTSSAPVMNPTNGEYVTRFMSRYGVAVLNNSATSFGNASDFYSKINVTNLRFF